MDAAQTLRYVFGRRNMKKDAILNPNSPKSLSYGNLLLYFEKIY